MRPIALFAIVLCMGLGVALGMVAAGWWDDPDERLLLTVLREVREQYIEDVSSPQLVDNAIRGILAGLDDHSVLLDEQTLTLMQEQASGKFSGIGVDLGLVDGFVTVLALLRDDAPAARAGIVAGDRMVAVDHRSLKGRTLRDAVNALRGAPGTEVHVRIRRGSVANLLDFNLARDTIAVASVQGRMLVPVYGYVKIDRFNTTTVGDLHRAVDALRQPGVLSGLVVDLRDNPGGLLLPAVDVADAFLNDGLIVSIKGRRDGVDRRYEAQSGELLAGVPLAVLLNRDTASASEVVAGALQDHNRAIVLGTKSYGKGSVQSVMYFQNRRAIKLTTAHYYTPAGRSIQETGIAPDIDIASNDEESRAQYDARLLREAVAHLELAALASAEQPAKKNVVAAVGLEPTTPAL